MDTTDFKAALVDVPADDGAIGQALDELDARITAWISAVSEAQSALAGLAQLEARGAELAAARAVAATAAELSATAPAAPAAEAETPALEAASPASASPPADSPAEAAAAAKKAGGLRIGHLTEKKPPAPAVRKGIMVYEEEAPELEKPAPAATDEDEALLAQLDPQLARQIRIKRRLCNNTKSVRQLLEEEKKDKKGKK